MYKSIVYALTCLFFLSSCYFTKALRFKKYKLEDLPKFAADSFQKASSPFTFYKGSIDLAIKKELDSTLIGSNKYAVAVIRHDTILYEFYNPDYKITDSTLLPSFSVAKSYVSTLIGIAIHEGKIKNVNEPITNYLPELKERDIRFQNITIQHVLDMRSGIKSSENYYNPMSDVLRLGFGKNIAKKALKINIERPPNQAFEYKSINTQLLALILERATEQKLQTYYQSKLATPLQLEHPSTWIVDDQKHREARAFCCMNMALLDYAKFGKLFLDRGRYNGQQIVPESWVEQSTNADTLQFYDGYKNQWWAWTENILFKDTALARQYFEKYPKKILSQTVLNQPIGKHHLYYKVVGEGYYARGLLGQYIHVIPERGLIIVHFGNNQNPEKPIKRGFEPLVRKHFMK